MNPFYNPIFLSKVIKSYLMDVDRLKNFNYEKLRNFQDRKLRKILKYSKTVPLYRDLYKKANINIEDIRGISDLSKLPFVTKKDIRRYYPNGIISSKDSKDNLIKISTSGTAGKSLSIYSTMFDVVFWFFIYIRILKDYNVNWMKDRLTIIGDLAPHTIGSSYLYQGLSNHLNRDIFFRNIQWLNTNDKPEKLIKKINDFNPDFIGGYPGMLGHLALLKEKGLGENIEPVYIATIGSVLDKTLKKYIQSIFKAAVFEVYGATEAGTIAYECKMGNIHVMSDLVYLEFLKNDIPVVSKEPGNLVVTRLHGGGTPIIRYCDLNDIVSPLYERCGCGLMEDLIHRVYGRESLSIITSNGKIMLASSFSEIFSKILYELKSNILLDTKIIQHSLNKIEIQLVVDEESKESSSSTDEIIGHLKHGFVEKMGKDVDINTRLVNKIEGKGPRIVSKVNRENININGYI
jgi:phenylacetate-CoA ligase